MTIYLIDYTVAMRYFYISKGKRDFLKFSTLKHKPGNYWVNIHLDFWISDVRWPICKAPLSSEFSGSHRGKYEVWCVLVDFFLVNFFLDYFVSDIWFRNHIKPLIPNMIVQSYDVSMQPVSVKRATCLYDLLTTSLQSRLNIW